MSMRRIEASGPRSVARPRPEESIAMKDEKIKVRATSNGQIIEVVVLSKRLNSIEIVLGQGVHSVRCELTPTRNGSAYAGSAMGRELVYERSRDDVKADLARAEGYREFRR
jgi:hypothetical protein